MKKNILSEKIIVIISVLLVMNTTYLFSDLVKPYGVNSWDTPDWAQDKLTEAGITHYRDFVIWGNAEPVDIPPGNINDSRWNWWTPYCGARIGKRIGAKIQYTVTDPPDWAKIEKIGVQNHIQKYCEFVSDLLNYIDTISSTTIDSIDVGNETYVWGDPFDKDPSWYYVDLLKAIYNVVKQHNPNIKVIPTPVFPDPQYPLGGRPLEWIIDELYQSGAKGYMDAVNIHYYVHDMGPARDPMYKGIFHFPTVIRYMKYLAEENGDLNIPVSNNEYGWLLCLNYPKDPCLTEDQKASYFYSILDVSRKSGFCEPPYMYPGHSGGYPNSHHTSALIYSADSSSATVVFTPSYYTYKNYSQQYPTWSSADYEPLKVLSPASQEITVINPGFESGNTNGWTGVVIDTTTKHSGNASGKSNIPGMIQSIGYPVEPNSLYEIMFWIKIDGDIPINCQVDGIGTFGTDTRKYQNTWRRRRCKYYTASNETLFVFNFIGKVRPFNNMYFVLINTSGTISNINRSTCKLATNFNIGKPIYSDTTSYTILNIPQSLSSLPGINTASVEVDSATGNNFLSFDLSQSGIIYIAYHDSNELKKIKTITGIDKPEWLQTWTDTSMTIDVINPEKSTDTYKVYSKTFSPGTIMLGANAGSRATFWIDDVSMKPLNMPQTSIYWDKPYISVTPTSLEFGEIDQYESKTLSFEIKNLGIGTLSGTIYSDKDWIEIDRTNFNGNDITVNVTANNAILSEKEGEFSGIINIISNGGNRTVTVNMTATCVLVKPNPYNPNNGKLAFFGSGIVPNNTKIKIYTLDRELVKILEEKEGKKIIEWDGKNENGSIVVNGIYMYIYESPKEKGIGKFTVIRK